MGVQRFLRQPIQWKSKIDQNAYAEPVFAESTPIKVRWSQKSSLRLNKEGKEIICSIYVLTIDEINIDDVLVIDGSEHPVVSIQRTPNIKGKMTFRELYLK